MCYNTIIIPYFRKQLKHYIKKYRSLKESVINELEEFDKNKAAHIGNNVYKIRLKCGDINKGKSKSFRLIILVIESDSFLVPITIYFKVDSENISKKELNEHLERVLMEL